jgi:hypothetical protein
MHRRHGEASVPFIDPPPRARREPIMVMSDAPRNRPARRRLTALVAGAALTVPSVAGPAAAAPPAPPEIASVVSDWNAVAMSTLFGDTSIPAQETFLFAAFMHAAVYDAVVGVHGRYQPYRWHQRAPRGTSATAAAAAAGHKILETYTPSSRTALDSALAASLARIPDGPAKRQGVAYGETVAQHLIDLRAHDGRHADVHFTQPPGPGVWRPTPPALLDMAVPWLGGVTPLLARSADQFAPPPPPALTSRRYTRDFTEVEKYGSATSADRSPDQTAVALFFSGNVGIQMNAALRDQAAGRNLDITDSARMFAAVDMTVADALITTWRAKLQYGSWRPITAIRLADTDGNPATAPDPAWTPLLVTPNYPDYISGYNAVIAAASGTLDHLFGPRSLHLTLISTAAPGAVRQYDSGAALRSDVVNARIWLGIHFRTADTAARTMGVHLAGWTSRHCFQPVRH